MLNEFIFNRDIDSLVDQQIDKHYDQYDSLVLCPECHGAKELMYSCCSGDIIDEDFPMCPDCKEHLGLEPCHICEGKGTVREEDLTIIKEVA